MTLCLQIKEFCEPGTIVDEALSICRKCNKSTPVANLDHTKCVSDPFHCNIGEFASKGIQCFSCPKRIPYVAVDGLGCVPDEYGCGEGVIINYDLMRCIPCPASFHIATFDKTKCIANATDCGFGIIADESQCKPCKESEYANILHTKCVSAPSDCGKGQFVNSTTKKQCQLCPPYTPFPSVDH